MTTDIRSKITEGTTTVFIHKQQTSSKGPGTKAPHPFYNPAMELNRDCSIAVAQWLIDSRKRPLQFLDGLSASGIRGVRFLNELIGDFEITINDWSKDAYDLIMKNIEQMDESKVHVTCKNIHILLASHHYDYIDIDPFGSPSVFIDSAIRSCRHLGIIACTATDTATLCGTYPTVCRRRYGAVPLHGTMMHEIGLRILLGFIAREAAKYDKGVEPILSYATDHYMRIYVQLHNNLNAANETISKIKVIPPNEFISFNRKKDYPIGPLWMGSLHNVNALKKIQSVVFSKTLSKKTMLIKLLDILEDESNAPPFFYTTDSISSELGISPPPLRLVMEKLKEEGYQVFRTHFHQSGFKTIAPQTYIKKIFLNTQHEKRKTH